MVRSTHIAAFTSMYAFVLYPSVAQAQTFQQIAGLVTGLLNQVVLLLMVLALLAFIWGAIKFIAQAGDEKGRAAGKQTMVWGTLALFLMVGIWGIVAIIKQTFFGT